jgi:hypothetical protein
MRRLEDKARSLCRQITIATKDEELKPIVVELRETLHQHIERFRARLAEYPNVIERRNQNRVSPLDIPAENASSAVRKALPPHQPSSKRSPQSE